MGCRAVGIPVAVNPLRRQVQQLLAAGKTVAYVCRVTGAPRHAVRDVGEQSGLSFIPGIDAFVPHPTKHAASADELIRLGLIAPTERCRNLANRALDALLAVSAELDRIEARRARGEHDPVHVRAWAAAAGVACPSRGPVPSAVLTAWEKAGRP